MDTLENADIDKKMVVKEDNTQQDATDFAAENHALKEKEQESKEIEEDLFSEREEDSKSLPIDDTIVSEEVTTTTTAQPKENIQDTTTTKTDQDTTQPVENNSTTHPENGTTEPIEQESKPIQPASLKQEEEAEEEEEDVKTNDTPAIPQSHEIVIPSYSRWFNLSKIHEIEKKSLPEFFTNRIPSKNPHVYVKYRNFMVNAYRLNPNEYFSVTTARRNICGDAAAIFRLHRFLMKWGLINYQVDATLLPKSIEPPFTGEYATKHDAPRGLFPFESYKPSVQLPDMAKLKKMMDTDDDTSTLHKYLREMKKKHDTLESNKINLRKTETDTENEVKNVTEDDKETTKNIHVGEDSRDSDLKPPPVKRLKILENKKDSWSQEELKMLLESIQKDGTDWYKISKQVGTKSPEQCILRFLQLPIEDKFLHGSDSSSGGLGPLKYAPHLPFSKAENPVLSTIAFLVGLVDPNVVRQMTNKVMKVDEGTVNTNTTSTLPSSPANGAKEGSEIALASLGHRSHILASNEERKMNFLVQELIQTQLQKVEHKLNILHKVEESMELEKKAIHIQQEDLLIQRLSQTKHFNNILGRLQGMLDTSADNKEALQRNINEIKDMLVHPPIMHVGTSFKGKVPNGFDNSKPEHITKPVSLEAPQLYRYWSA